MSKKETEKKDFLAKHPLVNKMARILLLVWVLYSTISTVINTTSGDYIKISDFLSSIRKIEPNDFPAQIIESVTNEVGCSFSSDEWKTGYGELIKKGNGLFSLASTTQTSLIQYERSLSSNAEILFKFEPVKGISPNVTIIAHDLYEIVVGDDNSKRVTVKANLIEGEPMQLISADHDENKSFYLPSEIELGSEVVVKITQKPLDKNSYELILNITYDDKQSPIIKSYHFDIPGIFEEPSKPLLVSLGIVNTGNAEDRTSRFKCFQISVIENGKHLSYVNSN